jgi:hypothetical protein
MWLAAPPGPTSIVDFPLPNTAPELGFGAGFEVALKTRRIIAGVNIAGLFA